MGTFYDRIAGIKAVFNRFNSGTAYGHNLVGNSLLRRTRNLCISAMLEAVRDRKQVIGIDHVNRVLMQFH